MARKSAKSPKAATSPRVANGVKGRRTGRPPDINIDDLPERYSKVKSFLEHHWGFFSLDLVTVKNSDAVKTIFNRVQGVEWMIPFRKHAACLLSDTALAATSKEIRATRKMLKNVEKREGQAWSDYHNTHPSASEAMEALKQAISNFQHALGSFPFFAVLSILAKEIRVETLNKRSAMLWESVREIQQQKKSLEEKLKAYEADFAQKEIVRFVNNNDRAHRTLINFARVIAGLPEWRWLHSIRKCKKLKLGASPPEYQYQIFERLKTIVRRMKPPKVELVEKRLRDELLSPDCDAMLRGYADMHWHDLQGAITSCGNITRQELPHRIMEKFLLNLQKPKDSVEREFAKRNRLSPSAR